VLCFEVAVESYQEHEDTYAYEGCAEGLSEMADLGLWTILLIAG
jgi:hypothetical protein